MTNFLSRPKVRVVEAFSLFMGSISPGFSRAFPIGGSDPRLRPERLQPRCGRTHLSWLIRLFWYDVAFIIGCAALFGACFITEPPGSSGPGQLLFLIPIGIFALWNIALLVSLFYGVRSLTQNQGPLPDRFRALGE